jgi:hypothetical protein
MRQEIDRIWNIISRHEKKLRGMNVNKAINKFFKRKRGYFRQQAPRGVHLALCVDTRDPWKQNRVRFFSPAFNLPKNAIATVATAPTSPQSVTTKISQLRWASPISSMGGFDDCGMTWVPPPGSTVCLLFQNGDPETAFYIGTTWHRDRGPVNNHNWNYDIDEYQKIFEGHRHGYMVGKNDESQVLPPFNTDNYQGYDLDTNSDVNLVPDAQTKTTWPHQYGWKTPEKHMVRMDDGDPKCNRRWKRFEIMSSMGHYFLMKDDPYHHCGEWTNPNCKISYIDIVPSVCIGSFISTSYISPVSSNIVISITDLPYVCLQGPENCPTSPEGSITPVEDEYLGTEYLCPGFSPPSTISTMPVDCLGVLRGLTDFCFSFNNQGKNRYHKHKQECFPFLCNKCALLQSGMQLLSRSGATLVMDDSVEEPRERPEWERALEEFDMDGCTGNFKGRTFLRSATGHYIELNDTEDQPKVRSIRNGINIVTASGNEICLNDHSKPCCIAGELRGIHIKSTANHTLDMVDDTNRQCSDERNGCSKTGPYAKKAFVRLRSGYGIAVTLSDSNDQTKTDQQYLQLMAPQKDNLVRGSHIFHMQERPSGPGQIFLRAGGDFIVQTYDSMVEVVGDEKDNPANKLEFVSRSKIVSVKDVYYNKAKTHVFWADDYILLLAGKDCGPYEGDDKGTPCVFPVVVAVQPIPEFVTAATGMKASTHVFASSLPSIPCEGIASDL